MPTLSTLRLPLWLSLGRPNHETGASPTEPKKSNENKDLGSNRAQRSQRFKTERNAKPRAKTAKRKPAQGRLRVNSTHSHADRGLEAYWTPRKRPQRSQKSKACRGPWPIRRAALERFWTCSEPPAISSTARISPITAGRIQSSATISPDRLR